MASIERKSHQDLAADVKQKSDETVAIVENLKLKFKHSRRSILSGPQKLVDGRLHDQLDLSDAEKIFRQTNRR